MPIASGFSQDLNPNYYVRKPAKTEILDESIYYKRDEPFQRPVEIVNRPVLRETVFMPERKPPPIIPVRDFYTVAPEPPPPPPPLVYNIDPINTGPQKSFDLIRACGLNADCPCWSWICIILAFIILLLLIALCLYYILERDGRI